MAVLRYLVSLLLLPLVAVAQTTPSAPQDNVADQALLMAAETGRTELINFALDNGADIDARDRRAKRSTALHLAVEGGHHTAVRLLLARGADANAVTAHDYTPLIVAADARDDPLMGVELIGAGAEVNAAGADGKTALMAAASRGHENFVSLLLINRAVPDAVDNAGRDALLLADVDAPAANGQTPLIIAVRTGNTATVNLLLEAGADVNRREVGNGNTALMYAANSGFADLVERLLASGADVDAMASDGWTAIQAAEMVGEAAIVERLRAAARGG
jgi:ankyrin repeat protein